MALEPPAEAITLGPSAVPQGRCCLICPVSLLTPMARLPHVLWCVTLCFCVMQLCPVHVRTVDIGCS